MEFRFRAVDERPSSYVSSSSGMSYFSEQALALRGNSSSDFRPNPDLMRNPNDMRESIQLQLEKERIREEIIAAEIARRRILEAEVRMELLMEREMALRRAAEGLSPEERQPMQFDPRFSQRVEERLGFSGPREFGALGAFDTLALPPLPQLCLPPIQEAMVQEDNRDKLIKLDKPRPNLSGAKRKAETLSAVGSSELHFADLKKKPVEEWSCALCQVSATSEKGLNEHLQGKKHKANEAGLRAQRMGENSSTAPGPKKTAKPATKFTKDKATASLGLGSKAGGEKSVKLNKTRNGSLQKMDVAQDFMGKDAEPQKQKNQSAENLKNKKDKDAEPQKQKNQSAENLKKKKETPKAQKVQHNVEFNKKMKFKLWCEMCQIGAFSEGVMEAHKKGKKHLTQLRELGQNDEAVPVTNTENIVADMHQIPLQ